MTTELSIHDPIEAIALLEEPNRLRLYDLVVASHEPVGRDQAAPRSGSAASWPRFTSIGLSGPALETGTDAEGAEAAQARAVRPSSIDARAASWLFRSRLARTARGRRRRDRHGARSHG